MRVFDNPELLRPLVGEVLGTSGWLAVTQQRIDAFAEATGDDQWIHVDPVRSAAGPFGAPIAHGFLTLALLPYLARQVYAVEGSDRRIDYGLDRVRFIKPVPAGARIRSTLRLTKLVDVEGGLQLHVTHTVGVETDGREQPACVAETVSRLYH